MVSYYIQIMETKNSQIFYCNKCDYKCNRENDYNKHLLTRKHMMETDWKPKTRQYVCGQCNKTYKNRGGLWKHQKKCIDSIETNNNQSVDIFQILKQNQEFKELMVEQTKQLQEQQQENQEFRELLFEQQQENQELQKQLIDVVKHTGNNIQNQTINHNNQKFNLNFFLNEQCKDAINMSEFIENMKLDMEDLTETGRLGYVDGISRILVNKLQELDIYKRPLHCTDVKRETLYIRENDEWSKEDNSKGKINELVNKVANKNCKNIQQWTDKHPDYQVFDSPENMDFVRLTQAVLGGLGHQECKQYRDKIIKNVIKDVIVHKL